MVDCVVYEVTVEFPDVVEFATDVSLVPFLPSVLSSNTDWFGKTGELPFVINGGIKPTLKGCGIA